jgi:integrase
VAPALPPALAIDLAGLSETDAARIAAVIAANHAPTTLVVYAYAWRQWQAWCIARGLCPLPASPIAVCAYLAERAEQGASFSTLEVACSAISHQHRRQGAANPIVDEAVRQVRRGLRRTLGTAPRRQARPLSVEEIRRIVTSIDRTSSLGVRDAALILLGFASAMRRSELADLALADLAAKPSGLLLTVRHSKTDPDRRGQVVGVAHGRHRNTDPVGALASWLAVRGTAPGPLFPRMRGRGAGSTPISGGTIPRILKARADAAGLPTARITGHSLRAGHVTSAAVAGVSVDRIAAQTRHRRIDVLIEHYIRPIDALQTTSSRELRL